VGAMGTTKVRQYCRVCRQVTTQVRYDDSSKWRCLCCASDNRSIRFSSADPPLKRGGGRKLNLSF
jgi:hypothetical protein